MSLKVYKIMLLCFAFQPEHLQHKSIYQAWPWGPEAINLVPNTLSLILSFEVSLDMKIDLLSASLLVCYSSTVGRVVERSPVLLRRAINGGLFITKAVVLALEAFVLLAHRLDVPVLLI